MTKLVRGSGFPKRLLLALAGVLSMIFLALAEAFGQTPTPILIELFTSEGCSSCPPADAFLRALDSAQPVPGAQLIVLEEHVDYWDDQGWKDPFSSHAFTRRQGEYEERLRVASGPYTPQLVVDGAYELSANDRRGAQQVLEKARATPKVTVELSSFEIKGEKVLAHVATAPVPTKAELICAIALDQAQSEVLAGENRQRHLEHVAVLRELVKVGQLGKGQSFSKDVSLSLPHSGQPYRLIAFVAERDQGKVLGAALARLPQ